ncbi:MAG: hypothetical protein Q8P11_03250 [bacterium]|nr:hypothetical protein [bacterium]
MTLSILLIPFGLLLVLWIIFSLLIIWNLLAYVKEMPAAGLLLIVYAIGSIIIMGVSWYYILAIDWGTPLINP